MSRSLVTARARKASEICSLWKIYLRYTRQRAQFFPIRTDLGWWITFLFFLKPNKSLRKKPPAVSGPDGENTARSRNQSDCRICRIPPAHELRKKINELQDTWKNYSVLIGSDKCSFQVIQCRRGLIQCKEVTNQTEQFLELFSRTLNCFAP